MNYNSGNARRNFYAKWVKLREEYQAAGMKEDAIQKMYEYDLAVFNDDRAHHRYDVEIPNGCKVKITYAEDGDSMEVLQKLIHDTLCEEAKNCS